MEPLIQARNSSLPTFLSTSECVSNSNQLLFLFSHLESVWGVGNCYLAKSGTSVMKGSLVGRVSRLDRFLAKYSSFFFFSYKDCSGTVTHKAFSDFSNVFLSLPPHLFSLSGKREFVFKRSTDLEKPFQPSEKFPFQTHKK